MTPFELEFKKLMAQLIIAYGGVVEFEGRWGNKRTEGDGNGREPTVTKNYPLTANDLQRQGIAPYGGHINANRDWTINALRRIQSDGVDYDRSGNWMDATHNEFTSTVNPSIPVPFGFMRLVANNSDEFYWWGVSLKAFGEDDSDGLGGIAKFVREIIAPKAPADWLDWDWCLNNAWGRVNQAPLGPHGTPGQYLHYHCAYGEVPSTEED